MTRGMIATQHRDPRIKKAVLNAYIVEGKRILPAARASGYTKHVVRDVLRAEGLVR